MENEQKCFYCDKKDDLVKAKGLVLCCKHYYQIHKYGKVIKTIYDKNDVIKYDDYAEIILRNKKGEEVGRAIVDLKDLDMVMQYKWSLNRHGYARTRLKDGRMLSLHKFITGTDENTIVDHINRNRLDNRKENLRIVSWNENAINKGLQSNNKSGVAGVSYYKRRKRWVAEIKYNGKKKVIGYFKNKEDAIRARLLEEKRLLGEYAPQKHLFEKYGIGEDDE